MRILRNEASISQIRGTDTRWSSQRSPTRSLLHAMRPERRSDGVVRDRTSGEHGPSHPALIADLDPETVVVEFGVKVDGPSRRSVKDSVRGSLTGQQAGIVVNNCTQLAAQTANQRSNLTGNSDTRGEMGLDLQARPTYPGWFTTKPPAQEVNLELS